MIDIRPADFADARLIDLLHTHLTRALEVTPRHSAHALDLGGLQVPAITVWAGWDGDTLVTVGALSQLAPDQAHRGAGHAGAMLRHIVAERSTLAAICAAAAGRSPG